MKKILSFLFFSLFIHYAQSQVFEWAAKDHWYQIDGGTCVRTDLSGNVYVAGEYKDGSNHYNPNAHAGSFMSKYTTQGALLWSISGIAGYQAMTGQIRMALDYNDMPVITGFDSTGFFIAKYSSNGILISKTILLPRSGNVYNSSIRGIEFDIQGNYYLTGIFITDTITFGTITFYNSANTPFLFLAKFDASGNCLWAKQNTKGGVYEYTCLSVDNQGNSYIGGDFIDTLTIDNFCITSAMTSNGFVVKYNSSGIAQWVYNINGSQAEWVSALSADNSGNVYAVGFYDKPLTVGSTTLPINGPWWNDAFIIKFNSSGTPLWAKQIGGNEKDFAEGVKADNDGNIFISGSFGTSANFGNITLSNSGYKEPFIAKYDSLGNCQWAIQTGGNGAGEGIALDNAHNIFVTGSFGAMMNFGENPLNGIPNSMFVTKIRDNAISGISESENSSFLTVYPNPTSGVFQINYFSTEKNKLQLNVFNSKGAIVYTESFQRIYTKPLDLSKQAKGVYFIEIISADKKRRIKRIVLD